MTAPQTMLTCLVGHDPHTRDTRMTLTGDLDAATDDQFIADVDYALALHPASLTLDLGRLRAIDDRGIELLAAAACRAHLATSRFRVVGASRHVVQVLDAAGLHIRADGHVQVRRTVPAPGSAGRQPAGR